MSEFTQALSDAAERNRELLAILAETDHAATALQHNGSHISNLNSQIYKTDKELRRLHAVTEDERKDHVKYRDSTFKRYAHKLGGRKGEAKFASKSEKEEREFMQAWQKEREAEERRAELQRSHDSANEERRHLERDKLRNDRAQGNLDTLYASIFSGPTPELPGEDQLEAAVQNAKQFLDQRQSQSDADQAAVDALRRVEHRMKAAGNSMQEALGMSRWDMMGGGTFADMMERDALSQAAVSISEALRQMDEARRCQPAITHLREIHVDMGHFVSDVLFDNIFTDYAQHERIHASNAQLMEAIGQLETEISKQLRRSQDAKRALQLAKGGLEEARVELQNIRAEAFERLPVPEDGLAMPPPSYMEASREMDDAPPPPPPLAQQQPQQQEGISKI